MAETQMHNRYIFMEEGDDMIVTCSDCYFQARHEYLTGEVHVLNLGDHTARHIITYIPGDLSLGFNLGEGSQDKPRL